MLTSEERAKISERGYGEGSAFDRIVIFEGQELPKSMNTPEINFEHFKKTLKVYEQMADYIENL